MLASSVDAEKGAPWLMLAVAVLSIFALYVLAFAVPPIISQLVGELNVSHEQAGLLMSVFVVVYCVGSVVAGLLSDRFGAKPVMASGLALASLAGLVFANTTNFPLMIATRAVIGWGAACIFAPGLRFILSWLPAERANIGVAWAGAGVNGGTGVTFFLTPILMASYGWGWPLQAYAIFGVIVAIAFWILAKDRRAASIAPAPVAKAGGEAGLGVLLRNRPLVLISVALFLVFFQLYGVITWMAPYFGEVLGLTPIEIGIVLLAFSLVGIPGGLFTGWFADRSGQRVNIIIVGSLIAASNVLLIFLTGAPFWMVVVLSAVISWGINMAYVPLFSLPALTVKPHLIGTATGFVTTWAFAGAIVSTYLGGYIVTVTNSYDMAFIVFAAAAALTAIVVCPTMKKFLPKA